MVAIIQCTYSGEDVLYAYPGEAGPSFEDYNDLRVPVVCVNGLCTAQVDTEQHGNIWYIFEGDNVPGSWDDHTFIANFSTTTPSIVVYPLASGDVPKVAPSTINMYVGEQTTASVTVDGDIDLRELDLVFVIQKVGGKDVNHVNNDSIARSAKSFTVAIPDTVTQAPNRFDWSLRLTTGNVLISHGVLVVAKAANVDES